MKKQILLALASFVLVGPLSAAIDFYEDGTVIEGDDFSSVRAYSDAIVDMWGGQVGWLSSHDSSTVNLFGGTVGNMTSKDTSEFNLYGGTITSGFVAIDGTSSINVYGDNFFEHLEDGRIFLSGTWEDGSTFDFFFDRKTELPENVTLHEIPEPASIALLGLGFLAIRKGTTL